MSTILVTGGAGYIGSLMCEHLLDLGYRVKLVDRFYFGRESVSRLVGRDNFELLHDDVRSMPAEVLDGVHAVVHLAAISNDPACDLDPNITRSVNLDGTLRTAALAKAAGVERFLFSSSCSVYGAAVSDVVDETSPTAPVSLYAQLKVEAERELAAMASDDFVVTSLRNATVYGASPRMRFDLVINMMTLYAQNMHKIFVLGGGKQWRPLVHVRDVVRSFVAVLEAPADAVAGEAFNVGSNDQCFQVQRLAQMVRDVIPGTQLEWVPDDPDRRSYNVDFTKLGEQLGFEVKYTPYEGIVEIRQALERGLMDDSIRTRTVEYYRYLLDAERVLKEVSLQGSVFEVAPG